MEVRCDKCRARYRVDDSRIGPQGLTMRCGKCQNTFKVTKPPAAAPAATQAAPAAPAPSPVPASPARDAAADQPVAAAGRSEAVARTDQAMPAPQRPRQRGLFIGLAAGLAALLIAGAALVASKKLGRHEPPPAARESRP